jgi:integrase/recombinase XerD
MNDLKEAIKDYLALRRGLGFKLKKHTRFLEEFAAFLRKAGKSTITSRLALQWATEPQHIKPCEWAARLSAVRLFARYLSAFDPRTEIPPQGLLPPHATRQALYLFRWRDPSTLGSR